MGNTIGNLFIDPTTLNGGTNCFYNGTASSDGLGSGDITSCEHHYKFYGFVQVLFLLGTYAYILSWSSNLISDGSELLLLVPSLRGIVGSVVLPILGAVPDGAIVLFSGMGAKDVVGEQVAVGVGALAGSTIMLLTIPWFLSVVAGRVDLDTSGVPNYRKPAGKRLTKKGFGSLFTTGVSCSREISVTSYIMIGTALSYILIQGPAFSAIHKYGTANQLELDEIASKVRDFALAGFLLCVVAFIAYLVYMIKYADVEQAADEAKKAAIGKQYITLSAAFALEMKHKATDFSQDDLPLLDNDKKTSDFMLSFFQKYDANKDGRMDSTELRLLLNDMNEKLTSEDFHALMNQMDTDKSGFIEFGEFRTAMVEHIRRFAQGEQKAPELANITTTDNAINQDDEDVAEEEEEVPEDLKDLSYDAQQRAVKLRSAWMMALGTIVVLLISDPMVDVLNDIGTRTDIKPFYVAFVLAPLASNASELIAAYKYAQKKTSKTISISLSTLEGAAIMNNTFCLGIFLVLIYVRDLSWTFSAETISIFSIQAVMVLYAQKKTHRLLDAFIILGLYPAALALVAILENVAHLD